MSRLWIYNLHYFDDLNASGSDERVQLHGELIHDWIDANPPGVGAGWEPYPASLRVVNWIKWSLAGNDLEEHVLSSLAIQLDWIDKNVEWHLLGNHLFVNAKALIMGGLYLDGRSARRWLKKGLRILQKELAAQILPDGGQFELSPMYHLLALEDVLDLVNAAGTWPGVIPPAVEATWIESARAMLEWSSIMRHDDGDIPLFGDSAFGIAPSPEELDRYAERFGIEPVPPRSVAWLRDSGFVRAANESALLFVDVGNIGPDYLPAHGHADALSIELSMFGARWIVDTGCSTYAVGKERLRQRGTAAHNTVVVDGLNSSDVWSSFRVGKRARIVGIDVRHQDQRVVVTAAHDGFQRAETSAIHERSIVLGESLLEIHDRLSGKFTHAESILHFHPEVRVTSKQDFVELSRAGRTVRLQITGGMLELMQSSWHPEFGLSRATTKAVIRHANESVEIRLSWE